VTRPLRRVLIAVGGLLALLVAVFAAAWFLMPKDWIDREARRQAALMKGATVRWTRLTPGIDWFSIGVKVEGLTLRVPDVGPPATDFHSNVIFVRLKLLPLLSRRVEVSSAKLDGAWVTLFEQPPKPENAPGTPPPPQFQIQVPRVDFHNVNLRTRDSLGSGMELKSLNGEAVFSGTLDAPAGIKITAKADSLFWKPSAAAGNMTLPSPLSLDTELQSRGGPGVLRVTRGKLDVGPLTSTIGGAIRFPKRDEKGGPEIDLEIAGDHPQKIDSEDRAFHALAAMSPAKWSGTAFWNMHVGGRAPDVVTKGMFETKDLSVRAQDNSFVMGLHVQWDTRADRTFIANGSGGEPGPGMAFNFQAKGLLTPGGATSGWVLVRAPATRLNGIVPNAPKWTSGNIEARADFELRPPAKPTIRWTVQGKGMDGTMQGLTHPVHGLEFDAEGNDVTANLKSLRVQVASTTMNVSGTIARGKPLSTGTFAVTMDKLIAEEWAPPTAGKAPEKVAAPPPTALPLPIGAFTGSVAIGEARSGAMVATNISTPVRYDGKDLVAAPIKGAIGTGSFEGAFNMVTPFTKPSYTLHMDVKRAPVEQIASGTIPFSSATTGFLSGILDLSGQGFPSAKPNDSLKGLLKGTLEDGKLKLSPAIVAITRALGLGERTEIPLTQETHSVRILGSKMLIDSAKGDLGQDKAEMNGWVSLEHALDLNVLLKLAPNRVKGSSVLARFAQYARDPEGRLPVGLRITGLDRAPKITINTEALIQTATKQLTSEAGKKLVDQLMKGLSSHADSVHKSDSTLVADSARQVQTPPKKAADSTAADPLKKASDALKHILGR
jgi:hypothetical protein